MTTMGNDSFNCLLRNTIGLPRCEKQPRILRKTFTLAYALTRRSANLYNFPIYFFPELKKSGLRLRMFKDKQVEHDKQNKHKTDP